VSLPITLRITRGAAPPPEPVGNWDLAANLPSGMTLVTDNPWTSEWGGWNIATNREGPMPEIGTDASQPETNIASGSVKTSDAVLIQSYAGTPDGFEPKFPISSLGNGLEVFISIVVKFLPSWENPITSGIKWHLVNAELDALDRSAGWFGTGNQVAGVQSAPAQYWVWDGTRADAPGSRPSAQPTLGAGLMTQGQWHKVQYRLRKDPALVQIRMNDVLIVDASGFEWTDPAGVFTTFQMGATWGGGATPNPAPEGTIIHYARSAIWTGS
jgi:hypothetical protein